MLMLEVAIFNIFIIEYYFAGGYGLFMAEDVFVFTK